MTLQRWVPILGPVAVVVAFIVAHHLGREVDISHPYIEDATDDPLGRGDIAPSRPRMELVV